MYTFSIEIRSSIKGISKALDVVAVNAIIETADHDKPSQISRVFDLSFTWETVNTLLFLVYLGNRKVIFRFKIKYNMGFFLHIFLVLRKDSFC